MNAKEMFEELGFIKNKSSCYNEEYILYEKPTQFDILTIEFKNGYFVYTSCQNAPMKTDRKVLKAINQQMKELHWIGEN